MHGKQLSLNVVICRLHLYMLCVLFLGIDSLEHKLNESERRAGAYMKRYNRIQVCMKTIHICSQ